MCTITTKRGEIMAKKIKKEVKNMDIKSLAWGNFYETGEIGAYLLYKKISEEENGTDNNEGDSPSGD